MPRVNPPFNPIVFPPRPQSVQTPSEKQIGALAQGVIDELATTKLKPERVKSPAGDLSGNGRYFKSTGWMTLPRQVNNLAQEVGLLRKVHTRSIAFDTACSDFQAECSRELRHLSIFRPSTWRALFLETVDLILIALFDGLLSVGTTRIAAHRVGEVRGGIRDRLAEMRRVELNALDKIQERPSLKLLEAYWMLGDLDRDQKEALFGLGKCLQNEGVYDLAASILKEYIQKNKMRLQAWQEYVQALKEGSKFREAEDAIRAIERFFAGQLSDEVKRALKNDTVSCLVGRGLLEPALKDYNELKDGATPELRQLMFDTLSRKELPNCNEKSVDTLKKLFYKLDSKVGDTTEEFWLNLLSQAAFAKKLELEGGKIISKLESFECGQVLTCLEKEVKGLEKKQAERLKLSEHGELNQSELPESLKSVLELAYQTRAKQLAMSSNTQIEAFRMLLDSLKKKPAEEARIGLLEERLNALL